MSDTLTADLETGAGTSATPTTEPQSMDSLMDAALEMDSSDELDTSEQPPPGVGVDRGDGRDIRGKFATKAEQDAAEAAAAAAATKPGTVVPKVADAKPDETKPVAGSPFRYRAMSQTHDLEGAAIDDTGNLIVPAAKHGEIREALNALHLVRGEYAPAIQRYKADIAQLTAKLEAKGPSETQAAALVEGIGAIMTIPDINERLQKLFDFAEQFPRFKQDAEVQYWKGQAQGGAKATAPAPAAPVVDAPSMPTPAAAVETTTEYFEQFKLLDQFRGVPDDDWKQLASEFTPFAFLRLATAEDAQAYPGVKPGAVVFDTDALSARMEQHATKTKAQRETAIGQTKLATTNARRTQTSVNAPPVAGGTQAPAKPPRRFNSKEEYEAWKQSDELD